MITFDYFPWATSFRVGEYITVHISSLHDLRGMNVNEKKYVITSDLSFAIFISSSSCHTVKHKYSFSAND